MIETLKQFNHKQKGYRAAFHIQSDEVMRLRCSPSIRQLSPTNEHREQFGLPFSGLCGVCCDVFFLDYVVH
jgi:hypothetical protein